MKLNVYVYIKFIFKFDRIIAILLLLLFIILCNEAKKDIL